ncbi:hypothetical protein FF1_003398 [Malus domestica]
MGHGPYKKGARPSRATRRGKDGREEAMGTSEESSKPRTQPIDDSRTVRYNLMFFCVAYGVLCQVRVVAGSDSITSANLRVAFPSA